MTPRKPTLLILPLVVTVFFAGACERDTSGLKPAKADSDPIVFEDNFGAGVDFQAFSGSKFDAVAIDQTQKHQGTASLKITVPPPGDPSGSYAGGAFTTFSGRDFSGYNALTFWAKASKAITLDVAGLGNDNTGTSIYEARLKNIPLTTTWTKIVVPIPLPARLEREGGLFYFAEGPEGGAGADVWFDEVRFENVTGIANPRPAMASKVVNATVGGTLTVEGTRTTFRVGGNDRIVEHMPGYFTFISSNEAVVKVVDGVIQAVGAGRATITGRLGTVDATGGLTVDVTTEPTTNDLIVFDDDFGQGVDFQAFLGSKLDAVSIDPTQKYEGATSLKVTVPSTGDPSGSYAGGAFTTLPTRNLSGYTALTFWAKASRPITFDVAGLGNDNTGTSLYGARRRDIPLTSTWTKIVIPIPLPAKLSNEGGLFFFAEGPEMGVGFDVWFDEVRFQVVPTVTNPRPEIQPKVVSAFVGGTVMIEGTRTTFSVDGTDRTIEHMSEYFTFASSNEDVARVAGAAIQAVGVGTATITGRLGTVAAGGAVTVNVTAAPSAPAPSPTVPASAVVSLFSNAYSNVAVDTWSADWDAADVGDLKIGGNDTKLYTNLTFAGIEFTTSPVDASTMTHFHLDLWIPQGTLFKIKLVDFGGDGIFGGGDDREHELAFSAGSTPPLVTGTWVGLEIPLASFTGLTTRAHLAQLILSGDAPTAFVDNIYFHR